MKFTRFNKKGCVCNLFYCLFCRIYKNDRYIISDRFYDLRIRIFFLKKFLQCHTKILTDIEEGLHRGEVFLILNIVDDNPYLSGRHEYFPLPSSHLHQQTLAHSSQISPDGSHPEDAKYKSFSIIPLCHQGNELL